VASPNLAGRDMYFILHENTGVNMPPEVNPTATPPAPANPASPLLSEGIHMINDSPTSAQLNANAADTDALTYAWTVISQPVSSTVILDPNDNPADPTTSSVENPVITVDTLGDYVLEVSVDDGTNPTVTAQVTVTALDNQAPNADVLGNLYNRTLYYDEVIRHLFDEQQLEAGFQDDGDPGLVVTTWSQLSGPGYLDFQDGPNAKDPNALILTEEGGIVDPSAAGVYVLKLDATDGVYDDLTPDTITITVLANIDPVADAGEATALISLAAPDSGILDLNGVVEEDDGYPLVPGAMTIEWTADDPLVGFGDPALAGTTANFNTAGEGTYVLTLTADDGGGNPGVDTIVVTVSKYAMAEIVL
ncbi:MAG: hypothetical protein KAT00_12530, partial [Planctomycetes bacterium]|nr:hypothetical protein [Planctomycetota bacterium]